MCSIKKTYSLCIFCKFESLFESPLARFRNGSHKIDKFLQTIIISIDK
jgi:hypothetical protein